MGEFRSQPLLQSVPTASRPLLRPLKAPTRDRLMTNSWHSFAPSSKVLFNKRNLIC